MQRRQDKWRDAPLPDNLEVERLVLGAILANGKLYPTLGALLNPDDFGLEKHKRIYLRIQDLYERGVEIDRVTVANELMVQGQLESVDGLSYLVSLDAGMPNLPSPEAYVDILREKAQLRKIISITDDSREAAMYGDEKPAEILNRLETSLIQMADDRSRKSLLSPGDIITEAGGVNDFLNPAQHAKGLRTGFLKLDAMTGGLREGELFILAARPAMGKMQPVSSPVKTPTGWAPIGELLVGSSLASLDGEPSIVTGVFPQGEKQIYRVLFSDGRSTRCGAEHLWAVQYRHWPTGKRIVTTETIAKLLTKKRYTSRLSIPRITGRFGSDPVFPLKPWLLGYLLGNGNLTSKTTLRVSVPDATTVDRLNLELSAHNCVLKYLSRIGYRIVVSNRPQGRRWTRNSLNSILHEIGCVPKRAEEKEIPLVCFEASKDFRLELLRGLLDSDGTAENGGAITFSSTSPALAQGVCRLVRSLGGISRITERSPAFTYKGEKKQGRRAYVVSVVMDVPGDVFWLDRKKVRAVRRSKNRPRLRILSVVEDGTERAVCISVSHPSQTYITDDFVVTHNTALALNIAHHVACNATERKAVAIFSLEMSRQSLLVRMVCAAARVDQQRFRNGYLNQDERRALQSSVISMIEAPLFIDDTAGTNLMDVHSKVKRLSTEYDLGLVVVDYLQLMQGRGRFENRVQEISTISRGFKLLSKELRVPFLVLSQLSRNPETRPGDHRPMLSDLRESGSIEQDADMVAFIFREEVYRPDKESLKGIAELILAKQRNGPTGRVKLAFLNRFTKFENLAVDSGDTASPFEDGVDDQTYSDN